MPSSSRFARSSRNTCATRQARAGIKLLIASPQSFSATFVKVIPTEYERVLQIVADAERAGKTHAQAENLPSRSSRAVPPRAPATCPACAMNQKEGR